MKHIGIDLHTRQFQACYIDENDRIAQRGYPLSKFGLDAFVRTLNREDLVAVESTGNSDFFKEMVKEHVAEVQIVCTRHFKVVSQSVKKTDRNDAYLLAHILKCDLLPLSRPKSPLQLQVYSLCKTRDNVVVQRTQSYNKIHAIYNSRGIPLLRDGLSSVKKLKQLDLTRLDKNQAWEVNFHRNAIYSLNRQETAVKKRIAELAPKLEGFEVLTSFKGVGLITAALVLAVSGEVSGFRNKKQFAAFFGLVPQLDESADKSRYGRITKRGNSLCRKVLIQCAQIVRQHNEGLQSFYARVAKQRGLKRANVAVARKLLDYMFDALRKESGSINVSNVQAT